MTRLLLALTTTSLFVPPEASAWDLFHPRPDDELRELNTDRPDITESPRTVDGGHFQLEADIGSWSHDEEFDQTTESLGFAILNLKAGLTDRIDMQVVVPVFLRNEVSDSETDLGSDSGVGDVSLRMKWNAWGNDEGPTALALMPFVTLPTAGDGVGADDVTVGLIAPLGVDLAPAWGFGTMLEVDWTGDGEDNWFDLVATATVGRDLTSSLGAFVEYVSVVSTDGEGSGLAQFDAGLTLAAGPNVQFDGGVNIGLSESADDVALFLGLAVRH